MLRLASTSATRAKLLERFSIEFEQISIDFDEESIKADRAEAFVYYASKGKLREALARYGDSETILCADTVIAAQDGSILRKASSREEAYDILGRISGSEIAIVTCAQLQREGLLFVDLSATHYSFHLFDERELDEYIRSGEWIGKAGACMVEGFCRRYIASVRGLESTAMGLQVEKIIPWLGDSWP